MKVVYRVTAMAALAACLNAPARAADVVTDALQAAYPAYRAALFRTNSKAQTESEQAIAQAQQGLRAVIDRFGSKPSAPYDRDPDFGATLAQVAAVFAKAEQQIKARQLPEAHETLEAARDLLATLRQRNGVIVFSDHMNAYHAEMEHLLIDGAKWLDQAQGLVRVTAQSGVLAYLARQLRQQAPANLARDAGFEAGLKAVADSVQALEGAVARQDPAAIRQAIEGLKKPYSQLFLKFG